MTEWEKVLEAASLAKLRESGWREGDPRYPCRLCPMVFAEKHDFQNHLWTRHYKAMSDYWRQSHRSEKTHGAGVGTSGAYAPSPVPLPRSFK